MGSGGTTGRGVPLMPVLRWCCKAAGTQPPDKTRVLPRHPRFSQAEESPSGSNQASKKKRTAPRLNPAFTSPSASV